MAASGDPVRLSLGTYGMQEFGVDRALAGIGEIGYDGAELCLMAGWPSEPTKLDGAARRRIRGQRLPIPSMIENFNLLVSEAEHARTLDRIRVAAALAHDVAPKDPPLLQTVMGGKPGEWEEVKAKMTEFRIAEWEERSVIVQALVDLYLYHEETIDSSTDRSRIFQQICRLDPVRALSLRS